MSATPAGQCGHEHDNDKNVIHMGTHICRRKNPHAGYHICSVCGYAWEQA